MVMHRRLVRPELSRALAGPLGLGRTLLAVGWLLGGVAALACGARDQQTASSSKPPSPDARPAISDFQVYGTLFGPDGGDSRRARTIVACFSMAPVAGHHLLVLVLTAGSTPPRAAYAPEVIGRSGLIDQERGRHCYPVPAPGVVSVDGEYTVWALYGTEVLAQKTVRDDPHPSAAPATPPAETASVVVSAASGPIIEELDVCDATAACGDPSERVSAGSVQVCLRFSTARAEQRVVLVATREDRPPADPFSTAVVAFSATVMADATLTCLFLHAVSPPLPAGDYWLWVLSDAGILSGMGFSLTR
jgi:hypothetical protein